jgi:peptidoglycan/LPS O-acetylase OafA/YrhL
LKKLYLEFIRGAAALIVLLYHCIEHHPAGNTTRHFYFSNWGTDAVMIFFILSGLVINMSHTSNPKTKLKFIQNRLLRLYPLFLFGLLLAFFAILLTRSAFPSIKEITGNLAMVSALKIYMNNIVPTVTSNEPLWSLSFEMFFYLVFMLTIGRYQKRALLAWFIIAIAVLPLYYSSISVGSLGHIFAIIAFSSVWLIGYYLYEFRDYYYTDKYTALFSIGALPLISRMHISTIYYDPVKYIIYALFAVPFFRYCLQTKSNGRRISWIYLIIPYTIIAYVVFKQPYITFTNFMIYGCLPVILMGVCGIIMLFNLKGKTIHFIYNAGDVLGKYSYSLYITHFPIFFLCAALFQNTLIYILVSIPNIFLIAYSLENWLQPTVTAYFKRTPRPVIFSSWKLGPDLLHLRNLNNRGEG